MQIEKHEEALKEVYKTIEDALSDKKGLVCHQRRLMAMLSLGVQHFFELHLHKTNSIKPGAQVKHEWFQMSEKNLLLKMASSLTKDTSKIMNIDIIISISKDVENNRNEIIYGVPLKDDKILRNKIDSFLELKKVIEND